ncbi:unnamed protein product [Oppiella nova]|uniref:40S ribosomal protein S2 n=1 Tax=Oppiella nova TaxID=334625 RepID=A0A7R9LUI5_9ACAR|nr:unnamed protein product [Oppiella nova]CAG2166430.1 unnamed protein product [Oppiella nova]
MADTTLQPLFKEAVHSEEVLAPEVEALDAVVEAAAEAEDGKIKSLEEIYRFSLPIEELEIIDFFIEADPSGQRTRFKAFVAIGDYNGHVWGGREVVATAIGGAIILAKLSVIPVRRGYWGNKIGKPHTVPRKVTGKCGSVLVRLIPAPETYSYLAPDSWPESPLNKSPHQEYHDYLSINTGAQALGSIHE